MRYHHPLQYTNHSVPFIGVRKLHATWSRLGGGSFKLGGCITCGGVMSQLAAVVGVVMVGDPGEKHGSAVALVGSGPFLTVRG